ncbi:MAG: 3-phosphoshikimate 1-carboxyvinyltransferase, partial [Thermoleophilia bacterium]
MTTVTFRPADAVAGTIAVPPDKSITHRAILLAAISDRRVVIDNPLQSDDTGATLAAARALGAGVEGGIGDGRVVVTGRGVRG